MLNIYGNKEMCKVYIMRQQMIWPNRFSFKCRKVSQMLSNDNPEVRKTQYEETYCKMLIGLHEKNKKSLLQQNSITQSTI
jgi:hypothetical protein